MISRYNRFIFFGGLISFLIFFNQLNAQQTVGLFTYNDTLSHNGMTLFAPMSNGEVFLIDNCGRKINSWETGTLPYFHSFLLEDGSLLYTERQTTTIFDEDSPGGTIRRFDWDGDLIWEFENPDYELSHHHDISVLPNGNILVVTDAYNSPNEILSNGRNTEYIPVFLASLTIVEYQPTFPSGANEIWRWESMDHLIQDFDDSKLNFGVVSEHPEKIDLNYTVDTIMLNSPDWHHVNSIDYNEELDQVMVSVRNFSEFWIIDHSTTTEEAATSLGGNSNQGGDLLYRWGNSEAYGRGTSNDRKLFLQHNAHWIPEGLNGAGNVAVFNNQLVENETSELLEMLPPTDIDGFYIIPETESFGPEEVLWSYTAPDFYSGHIAGFQRLSNGNTLVCEGAKGRFFEITEDEEVVWEYINPVGTFGPVAQEVTPTANLVFQIKRYDIDYLEDTLIELESGDPIELEPYEYDCPLDQDSIISVLELYTDIHQLQVFINPSGNIQVTLPSANGNLYVYDSMGRVVFREQPDTLVTTISSGNLGSGVYMVLYEIGGVVYFGRVVREY